MVKVFQKPGYAISSSKTQILSPVNVLFWFQNRLTEWREMKTNMQDHKPGYCYDHM